MVDLSTVSVFPSCRKTFLNTVSWFHLIQLLPNYSFWSHPVKLMRYDWRNCGPCWDPTSCTKELWRHQFLNVVFTDVFVWGGVAILLVLNLVRNRVLNFCRIWSTTQLNTPTPLPRSHTPSVFTVRLLGKRWRVGGGQREGKRATVHKRCRKYQHDWLFLHSINSTIHQ